jgi:hypothetical protein
MSNAVAKKQVSLVACGFKVKTTTDKDITDKYKKVEINYKKYSSRELIRDIKEREAFARYLFKVNNKSDEYYTRAVSWERFLTENNMLGQKVFEPFYGDGSSKEALRELVEVVGENKDFWEQIQDPNCPQHFILSNPPFSCKWQIIQTLCEKKRDFALILPWEVFYDKYKYTDGKKTKTVQYECPLKAYIAEYGGQYTVYKMNAAEQMYWSPVLQDYKQIGTSILYWKF